MKWNNFLKKQLEIPDEALVLIMVISFLSGCFLKDLFI